MVKTLSARASSDILDIVHRHEEEVSKGQNKEEVLFTVHGSILSSLTADGRCRGNTFGYMVADAMAHYYKSDLAIINGGFIRANRQYPPGTRVTVGDILKELPFPREAVMLQLCGRDLKAAMEEEMAFLPAQSGAFPHVSEGWTVDFDPRQPVGSRIKSLKRHGKAYDPDTKYTVAVTMFMKEGGDNCVSFTRGRVISEEGMHIKVSTVVLNYLRYLQRDATHGNHNQAGFRYLVAEARMHQLHP